MPNNIKLEDLARQIHGAQDPLSRIDLSQSQVDFLARTEDEALWIGGPATGRTFALCYAALRGITFHSWQVAIISPFHQMNIFCADLIQSFLVMSPSTIHTFNRSTMTFAFSSGANIRFFVSQDDANMTRLRAYHFTQIYLNELTYVSAAKYEALRHCLLPSEPTIFHRQILGVARWDMASIPLWFADHFQFTSTRGPIRSQNFPTEYRDEYLLPDKILPMWRPSIEIPWFPRRDD